MNRDKTVQTIISCIGRIRQPLKAVQIESRLVDDLGFESIDVVDLIFEIQQALDIEIEFSEILISKGQTLKYQELQVLHLVDLISSKAR